ncbi:hypothetical protein TorRG33x02_119300 [Trema orientale]|uniref:Uncharacterized protein n=1 Tax=Trema orientale TaxID=63057 RepID=A0A2P5F3D2_TREOI|nr:hypothetical protein TorRG33x02_119300 [Trema orientale]
MRGRSPDIVIELSSSFSTLSFRHSLKDIGRKNESLKKWLRMRKLVVGEESTEFDQLLREVDQYLEGDEATSSRIESSEEASSSSGKVIFIK